MNKSVYNLANLITLLNLMSGSIAVYFASVKIDFFIPYLVLFSLIMDFLDGLVARKMNSSGSVGKDLDSLADVISFGLLPSILILRMFSYDGLTSWILFIVPFIVVAATALRLAKFNHEERDADTFYGLNSPTNTIFFVGLYLAWLDNTYGLVDLFYHNAWLMLALVLLSSFLLLSDYRMLSNKSIFSNRRTLMLIGGLIVFVLISIPFLGHISLSIGVLLYIIISLVTLNINKFKK